MSLSERERLERLPLKYELVVFLGRQEIKRTVAVGELAAVQADAHHLAIALDGDRVEYTRIRQTVPPPPAGAPKWWIGRQGQAIAAGVTYDLRVRRETAVDRDPGIRPTIEELVR